VELASRYPWGALANQAGTMNRCLGCHETDDLHTCATCHDEHGSIEMAQVPFNELLLLSGDVPDPGYIRINDILPYRDQLETSISLIEFLEQHGAGDFESVTLGSTDGAYGSVARPDLTEEARLLPHMDGIRFAPPNLHISVWLKGIWLIIVSAPTSRFRWTGSLPPLAGCFSALLVWLRSNKQM
jgi:hypothetical protein